MKIQVTANDIENGIRKRASLCPVALAINRTLGLGTTLRKTAAVAGPHVYIPDLSYNIPLPYHAADWIKNYDNHGPVEPFEFEIDYEAPTPS